MGTINTHTFVTNFNADGQANGIELMTDERGHMYPISHLFTGSTAGTALKVTPPSTAGLYVTVTAGYIQIPFADYAYLGWLETDQALTITADTSAGPRYVAVVAYIDRGKQFAESSTNNPGLLVITEVDGAVSSNPSQVNASTIVNAIGDDNPYVVLAQVYLSSNASSISASNIIDKRTGISLQSGIKLPDGSYPYGVYQATGGNSTNPLKIAVINANDAVPSSSSTDLLVIRIAQ